MKTLLTVDEVIDALGGTTAVQALLGYASHTSISNWRARGSCAPETFHVLASELRIRGFEAPPALWSMRERATEPPAFDETRVAV